MFYPDKPAYTATLLACLLLAATAAHAAPAGKPYMSLSRWLDQSAAVELADKLSSHPKFKGQALRLGAVIDSQPAMYSNRLNVSIQQRLAHQILKRGKNDIVLNNPSRCAVPDQTRYYLGVSVAPVTRTRHRVHITLMDMDSYRLVSGVSLSWQGRLTSDERTMLAAAARPAQPGSATHPLPLHDPRLLTALVQQADCSPARHLPGLIYLSAADDKDLDRVLRELEHQLTGNAGWVFTSNQTDADWLLDAELLNAGAQNKRLNVHLQAPAKQQRYLLGGVYVTDPGQPPAAPAPPPQPVAGAYVQRPAGALIRSFKKVRDNSCRNCISVALTLRYPAHVLVFSTAQSNPTPLSCSGELALRDAGDYQFRIKRSTSPSFHRRPSSGIYVLASTDPAQLRAMAAAVRNASTKCNPDNPDAAATRQLLELVRSGESQVQWKALHFQQRPYGLVNI